MCSNVGHKQYSIHRPTDRALDVAIVVIVGRVGPRAIRTRGAREMRADRLAGRGQPLDLA